jgi:uncharacterized protein (DUF486 family)
MIHGDACFAYFNKIWGIPLAWYGHLRLKEVPLTGVIVASWAVAFVEYCMAVPANRWGSAVYTTSSLASPSSISKNR